MSTTGAYLSGLTVAVMVWGAMIFTVLRSIERELRVHNERENAREQHEGGP